MKKKKPKKKSLLKKIVSGGQTGADRGALNAALEIEFLCGGWCPKGRVAEDGTIPHHYPLTDTPTSGYAERTLWNVRDSDGTIIFCHGEPTGGTALTIRFAGNLKKPCLLINLDQDTPLKLIFKWIKECKIEVLNVAGPRESRQAGIQGEVKEWIKKIISLSLK